MTTYPIISKVTGDPYYDFVHEFELQIDALFILHERTTDTDARRRIEARAVDLEDMIDRFCE